MRKRIEEKLARLRSGRRLVLTEKKQLNLLKQRIEGWNNKHMNLRRWILLGLLVIAVGVTAAYFLLGEGYGWELLVYIYAVPVYVVNGIEWLEEPEFMEKLVEVFGKRKETWGLWDKDKH